MRTTTMLRSMLAVLVLGVAPAVFAQASPPPDASPARVAPPADGAASQARALFEAGQASYKIGDFKAAIQAFEQAFVLDPRPALLFSIGQAHRRQYVVDGRAGHVAVAIKSFKDYLAKVESGGRRADAADALAELGPVALQLEIEGRLQPLEDEEPETRLVVSSRVEGASISVDGGAPRPMPLSAILTPGKHTVVLTAPGYAEERREVEVAKGGVTALDLPMSGLPARLSVAGPDGAIVTVDGRAEGTLPLANPLELDAGRRRVRVAMSGHEELVEVLTLERGQPAALSAELTPTSQRTAAYGLFIGAAGLFAAGAGLGGYALVRHAEAASLSDDFDAGAVTCRDPVCEPLDDYNDAIAARDATGIASGVLLGGAVLAGVGGLLLFTLDPPAEDRGPAATTTPASTPDAPSVELEVGPVTSIRVRFF